MDVYTFAEVEPVHEEAVRADGSEQRSSATSATHTRSPGRTVFRWVRVGLLAVVAAIVAGSVIGWTAGWRIEVVRTSSMEPTVPRHALVLVKPVAGSDVAVGDVIAFHPPGRTDRTILHRVTSVTEVNGDRFFHTKGDANDAEDAGAISDQAIQGRMGWYATRIGPAVGLLLTPLGPMLLIGAPLLYVVVAESLRAGRLARLLPDWKLPDADIVALIGQRHGTAARVKLFLSFLQARFQPVPPWRMKAP